MPATKKQNRQYECSARRRAQKQRYNRSKKGLSTRHVQQLTDQYKRIGRRGLRAFNARKRLGKIVQAINELIGDLP
jgi:hypothetical protein